MTDTDDSRPKHGIVGGTETVENICKHVAEGRGDADDE